MATKAKTNTYLNNPNLPTGDSTFEYTPEMAAQYKKCRNKIEYFASNFFYITTLDEGKKVINLYPAQKRVLKSTSKNRFMVLLSSRQAGKTTIMTIYALWHTVFQKDKRVLIVANKEDTAIMILRRIRTAYEQLPNWLKPGVKQWGKTEVIFTNDSSITISSTSSSTARGDSINALIVDEMAFIPVHIMDEFWNSVLPVISSSRTTKIFAVSTPNGTGNKFHELYTSVERGDLKDWVHERIDWWDIPGRGKKWKREMLQALGDQAAFNQEYGNCFLETGESAIDSNIIDHYRSTCVDCKYVMDDGHYKIWEDPRSDHIYIFGVDVAEGVGEAASVVQVLDITDLTDIRQVATYHNEQIDPYHFAKQIHELTRNWGQPWVIIERNNCGGQVIDALVNTHHYNNLVDYTPKKQKYYNRLGVYSHTNSKYKGITNMRYWMNSLRCVEVRDISLVHEIETFIRHNNNTWKKKSGKHTRDDRVMAMCWALFILNEEITHQYFDIVSYDDQGKPSKLQAQYIAPPEYFKLDKYYLRDDAPLPIHFSGSQNMDDELIDLQSQGWLPLV